MHKDNIQSNDNIPELQSPFEQLREVDADGREWWRVLRDTLKRVR